jgi:hypothetical protein
VAEPDGDARLPFDVELVGALEGARVACRRPGDEEHGEAGGHRAALELARFFAVPALVLGRRQVAEDLLDRPRDLLVVVEHRLPLVRVLPEEHDCVADELRHRLGPCSTEE